MVKPNTWKKERLNFLLLVSSNEGLLDAIRFYFYGSGFLLNFFLDKLGTKGFLTNFFMDVGSYCQGTSWMLGKTISALYHCFLHFHRRIFAILGPSQILMNPDMEYVNYQHLPHKKWLGFGEHRKPNLVLVIRNVEQIWANNRAT